MTTTHDPSTGLYTAEHFERQLNAEAKVAMLEDRAYAVVACVPRRLPGEGVGKIIAAAAACVQKLVRDHDLAGRLSDDSLVIGLPDTDPEGARVFSHRLQSDFSLRSFNLRNTVWDAGFACLPEDGFTAQELIEAAVESAKTRQRRLADAPPPLSIALEV